jgi:hypothetical protein
MTNINKNYALGLVVCILLAATAVWWVYLRPGGSGPTASSGGVELEIPSTSGGAYYLQGDPRWANDSIGGSGESLGAVGCTICSVATAASDLGYAIDPKELNARLIRQGGYTDRGWLIWGKISAATEGAIFVEVCDSPSREGIDACLQSGGIPIVKIFLPGGAPHWVAVVGKSGREYMVKDPLSAGKKVRKLSDIAKTIVSVRYVRKR